MTGVPRGEPKRGPVVEFFPDAKVLNFRRLIDRQLEVRDGALVLHEGPGFGFNFDSDAVEAFALEPWHTVGREAPTKVLA